MDFNFALLIQAFIVIIVIGVIFNLWRTARTYGGLVGAGLKWIGIGMVFFSLEALDRVLGNLSFINSFGLVNAELAHYLILFFGLLFSAIGFSRLTKITR